MRIYLFYVGNLKDNENEKKAMSFDTQERKEEKKHI